MKAYKVEIVVVDFEGHGANILYDNIENMKYYSPNIISMVEADIGEWDDHHPLNLGGTPKKEVLAYFPINDNENY